MKIIGDQAIFATGRTEYACCGIIGIAPDLTVTNGFDGDFHAPKEEWMLEDEYKGLTPKEQIELADYMIEQWKKFRAKA